MMIHIMCRIMAQNHDIIGAAEFVMHARTEGGWGAQTISEGTEIFEAPARPARLCLSPSW